VRYCLLKLIATKISQSGKLYCIRRIGDNILELSLANGESYCCDLSQSVVYKKDKSDFEKRYSAPFDTALAKLFSNARIVSCELSKTDKTIFLVAEGTQGYKKHQATLILEFSPKAKNAVITDENSIVSFALRYTSDEHRTLMQDEKYEPLPPPNFEFQECDGTIDLEAQLESVKLEHFTKKLEAFKKQKVMELGKKIATLRKSLDSVSDAEELQVQSQVFKNAANFVLTNLDLVDVYAKTIDFDDDGIKRKIPTPSGMKPSEIANQLFAKSKKLAKKSYGVAQEMESLAGKMEFYEKLSKIIEKAGDTGQIEMLLPKQKAKAKEAKTDGDIYEIFVDAHKISVGKNKKGNEKLLKLSKANDYWFHIKDRPSAHTVLGCQRNEPSRALLEKTAKICAEFSLSQKGFVDVDFAKRRDVSPQGGASVLYVNYKTLRVRLD
jgi:predicted ribosome quality control (RQC) complex YloA/Tae2 family protein